MLPAFSQATDRLFARLGVQATYHPQGSSNNITLPVILKIPDHIVDFGEAHLHTSTQVIDVKCNDVKEPKIGDVITIDKSSYRIQSEPVRDLHGLIWKIDVIKVCN